MMKDTTTMRDTAADLMRGTPWWLVLIEGIIMAIVGLLLLFSPARTTIVLVQLLGIFWLVSGILGLVSLFIDRSLWGWKLFAGILGILAGFSVIRNPLWSAILVPTVIVIYLGVQAIITGCINLYQAFSGGGWGIGILGVVNIILGIILLANPLIAAVALPFVLGIIALIGGIVAIVSAFRMHSSTTEMPKTMPV